MNDAENYNKETQCNIYSLPSQNIKIVKRHIYLLT